MDHYMSILFMLTISFPEAMLSAYLTIFLMGKRPKTVEIVLIGLTQMVVAYIVRTLPIPVGLHSILQIVSLIGIIFIISRLPFWSSAIGVLAVFVLYIIEETAIFQLTLYLTGMTIQSVINDPYMRIFFYIPVAGAVFLTIVLFRRYNITFTRLTKWRYKSEESLLEPEPESSMLMQKQYLPAVIFIFLPVLLLFILNFTYVSVVYEDYSGHISNVFKILINALIIVLALVSVWTLRKISKSIEKEYEAKRFAETIEKLKELIYSIRKQRHDFNHHLQTVYGLIETGSYGDAREYIEKTYHYISGTGELIKTDNPGISALLYSKIGIAETRNIKFDISIECSLEDFPPKSNEASSLLGNLIDNAFDAVTRDNSANRAVRLDVTSERGEYLVEVANGGEIDPEFTEKIFNANFTTKKSHSGLGLTIVKEIAAKYKGSIDVASGGGETAFRVKIPFKR